VTYPHVKYLGPAHPNASGPATMREVHSHVNDGIKVDLLWSERNGRAWVVPQEASTSRPSSPHITWKVPSRSTRL
jgi:hypothetical protein